MIKKARLNTTFKRNKTALSYWLCIAAVAALIASGCQRFDDSIIIVGSTSVQPFAEILGEDFEILHPGEKIFVQGGGSAAGIAAAVNRTADLGMSSRYLKEEEADLWSLTIAIDGLAVIVNPDNPLTDISLQELQLIYCRQAEYWSEVGGSQGKIHIVTREEGSGTRSAFEGLVMGEMEISPKAIVQDSNGAVRQLIASDRNAIGFISLGMVDETVKALCIAGIAATEENVLLGNYNLYRPFILVAPEPPQGIAKEFIDYILSPRGRELLRSEGLIVKLGED